MQQINKPYEGLFITVEGCEGSGKTTVCQKLEEDLKKRGFDVILTREPGGSALSDVLRKLLLNPNKEVKIGERAEIFLFLAARVEHIEELILPALRHGKIVICDRFNDSSIAYQGCARHLGKHYVETLCHLATEGLSEPNFTLLLDLDPAIGLKRTQKSQKNAFDRIEQEILQFHKDVRQGYLHLADEHPERIEIIDAAKPIQEVTEACIKALQPHLSLKATRQ